MTAHRKHDNVRLRAYGVTTSSVPATASARGNHAELTAAALAKQPGVKQPGVNFSSRRCADIELGILLP